MTPLKLEVGGEYLDRKGRTWVVVERVKASDAPFPYKARCMDMPANGVVNVQWFTANGDWVTPRKAGEDGGWTRRASECDLVKKAGQAV